MRNITRRRALAQIAALAAAPFTASNALAQRQQRRPRTFAARGLSIFAAVDRTMHEILDQQELAGGSIAMAHRGQMVLHRGYGLANVQQEIPVRPDTLFSTASVSKPFTAIGVLKLVGEGRLALDAPMLDVLAPLAPGEPIADPRIRQITVHQLLFHGSGFQHDVHVELPSGAEDALTREKALLMYRKGLTLPLEFSPGSTHKYSNFGFVVLRLVIEQVTGQDYESTIQQQVLVPMGVERMELEHGGGYLSDETHRYQVGGRRPAMRQAANWLATPTALVRFASAVAGSGGSEPFLGPQLTQQMVSLPPGIQPGPRGGHVGLGWDRTERVNGGFQFSKNGGKGGVRAWLEHLPYGVDWAVMFNTDPPDKHDVLSETRNRLLPVFERKFAGR